MSKPHEVGLQVPRIGAKKLTNSVQVSVGSGGSFFGGIGDLTSIKWSDFWNFTTQVIHISGHSSSMFVGHQYILGN